MGNSLSDQMFSASLFLDKTCPSRRFVKVLSALSALLVFFHKHFVVTFHNARSLIDLQV